MKNYPSPMAPPLTTRLLCIADQPESGKCVFVVALPKSQSFIAPLELNSKFSTCKSKRLIATTKMARKITKMIRFIYS
jgi:hypothetical protein